jgi:Uma2 family endonuclease
MGETGIFAADDRVELIEGEIIQMSPIGTAHAGCVNALGDLLKRRLGRSVIVSTQNPVTLSRHSEPLPDIAVLRSREDFYRRRHPEPGDIFLSVEVADTTPASERGVKIPAYARAGVTEVWLIDLPQETVEAYREPAMRRYRHVERFARGRQRVSIAAFPRKSFRVNAMLG